MIIIIKKEISDDRITDLLAGAFDGGSRSWAQFGNTFNPTEEKYMTHIPLTPAGYVEIVDSEDNEAVYKLDRAHILTGLQFFADKYPSSYADFLNENEDAATGDIFLQCCLFDEMRYS